MKYSILGFSQEKVVSYEVDGLKCDLTDLLLLNYIIYAQSNPKMKHILDDEEQPCVWLQHKHLLEDLPILNITEGTLKNRLTKLRKMNLIASKTVADQSMQGTNTYYRTTSFLHDLLFETTSLKNDVKEQPRHFKMTSDTQANLNTEVNTNSSKELLQNFQFGTKQTKPKKENLYSKCVSLIDLKTGDLKIRQLLIDWLNMLLEKYRNTGRVLYANVFKGKLNMLDKFDERDWRSIIEFSIQRGYEGFYPVTGTSSDIKNKPWEQGVTCEAYTKEELEAEQKDIQARLKRGERVYF